MPLALETNAQEKVHPLIRHIHLNEMDGSHPGAKDYNFSPVFAILEKLKYHGWVSVEAFDFEIGAESIARLSMEHMRKAAGF